MKTSNLRWLTGLIAITGCMPLALCQAPDRTQAFDPGATMRSAAAVLVEGHISHHPLDDSISEHAFAALFDELDPQRLFFLQSDVDDLRQNERLLDDYVLAGDVGFAMRLQGLYETRVREASELAQQLIASPPDFSIQETLPTDGKLLGFASSWTDLGDRWRRRVKLDWLALQYGGLEDRTVAERLHERYARMAVEHGTLDTATERFLDAITSCYDPHTTYFSPRAAEDFAIAMRLNYEGIGAVLGQEDGRIVVLKLMDGGSARASGEMQVGDVILAVGADDGGAMEPVDGWSLRDVVDRIRGPRGTFVRLQLSGDGPEPRIVTLERRRTELSDQFATGQIFNEGHLRIGWIELPGFYADPKGSHSATRDVARLLADFVAEGVGCIVLDLRANGGGLLSEAVSMTGLFLEGGNVVRVEGSDGRTKRFDDPDRRALWTGPLVVLTSRLSASASEILAGAIQDNSRGLVVGDSTTHGKGTVQSVVDLADYPVRRGDHPSGELKLTIQQFYRPGGGSTQLRGVHADVVLPAWTESVAEGEAAADNALPFRSIGPLVSGESVARNAVLVAELVEASASRVAASPEFGAVERANRARVELHARKQIPLERSAYSAYREAVKVRLVDDDPSKEPAFYRSEVCKIAGDYVRALSGIRVAARAAGNSRAMTVRPGSLVASTRPS